MERFRDPGKVKNLNLARLKRSGLTFEVAIHPDKAIAYKEGKDVMIEDVIYADGVFHDLKKNKPAELKTLKTVFGTDNIVDVEKTIIKEGEIQTTAEYREKQREEKKKRIVNLITVNAVDPKTNLPHPPTRILNAMEEVKVRIDDNKSAEAQIAEVVHQLRKVLPIRFETDTIELRVPSSGVGKCMPIIKQQNIKKEEWLNDGSLLAVVEVPAGLREDFISKINKCTHGGCDIKVKNRL